MKNLLKSLRALIAAGTLAGFLGGWALIAHAQVPATADVAQPAPAAQAAPAAQVAPITRSTSQQVVPIVPRLSSQFTLQPRLRTGGS